MDGAVEKDKNIKGWLEWMCENHRICLLALLWSKFEPPCLHLSRLLEKLPVYVMRKQVIFGLEWREA
jgi:hypothetical protein